MLRCWSGSSCSSWVRKRPLWQMLLGAALTAPLVLTRENMAFVPPILFLYIFWQHGWKAGLLAGLCAGICSWQGMHFTSRTT